MYAIFLDEDEEEEEAEEDKPGNPEKNEIVAEATAADSNKIAQAVDVSTVAPTKKPTKKKEEGGLIGLVNAFIEDDDEDQKDASPSKESEVDKEENDEGKAFRTICSVPA